MSKIKIFIIFACTFLSVFASTPKFLKVPMTIKSSKIYSSSQLNSWFKKTTDSLIKEPYLSDFTITWQEKAIVPADRYRPAGCCDTSGNFYVIGGWANSTASNVVFKYFTDRDSWCRVANLPYSVTNHCAVYYPLTNLIYIFCGYDGNNALNYTQIYNIAQDSWYLGTSASQPMVGTYGAAIGDSIFITGADSNGTNLGIWCYQASTNIWSYIGLLPGSSASGGAASYGNKVYFSGGWPDKDTVAVYEIGIGASVFTQMPRGQHGHGSEIINSKLWIFGGGQAWGRATANVYSYDLVQGPGGNWTLENPMVSTRYAGAYCKILYQDTWRLHAATGLTGVSSRFNLHEQGTITPPFIRDVAVTEIVDPDPIMWDTMVFNPITATVHNFGEIPETFALTFDITGPNGFSYTNSRTVTNLGVGTQENVSFDTVVFHYVGTYHAMCYVNPSIPGDTNLHNDTAYLTFEVNCHVCRYWYSMSGIPTSPSGKKPKSGTCMAGLDATGKVYLLKASNTSDFYAYNPTENTWTELEPIPKGLKENGDGRNPKHGAAIAAYEPNKSVYVLRGNNTVGFWKYQADTVTGIDTIGWKKLANIPGKYKRCKYKSDLVAVSKQDNNYLFCMKGANTDEFYLYDIIQDTWFKVKSPPIGSSGKIRYKKGSCLCYDGNEYVYVLQGYYGSFFKYNIESDSWIELDRYNYRIYLNRNGRRKKPKGGASLVYYNNNIYMLKGGNSNEVWRYSVATDTWTQMSTGWNIPLYPTEKKKVKDGGSMIKFGYFFFASKGNNTSDFYRSFLPSYETRKLVKSKNEEGITGNRTEINNFQLFITPNPVNNSAVLKYSLPVPGPVHIKLYDVSGKLVKSYNNPNPTQKGMFIIDCKKLPSGIYLLRFDSNKIKVTRKIVFSKNE